MGKVLTVLDSTGSMPTPPLAMEQQPDASLVQKTPESLYSHWDLALLRYFKYVNTSELGSYSKILFNKI